MNIRVAPSPQAESFSLAPSLKIAHVITRFVRGGADENTLYSCNAQAAAGHKVCLIYGRDCSTEMLARLDGGVEQICLPSLVRKIDPLNDMKALVTLARELQRVQPDIVHTHTSKAGVLGRLAAFLIDAPTVVHGVHIVPFVNVGRAERLVYLTLERLLAPVTDAFVSVSGEMRDLCITSDVGSPPAHKVVPSGMDVARFRHAAPVEAGEISAVFGPPRFDRHKLIVIAAALEPRKRIVEFLPVFARIAAQEPAARLAILGEGIERLRALDAIDRLGLEGKASLLGFRQDVEKWLASADVCVFASEHEGLPRAVVQYVLASRPVVTTKLPGIDRVVHDGQNGFVTETDDLDAMADPILRLLREPALAAKFAAYSSQLNLSAWSVENMMTSLDEVYRDAADNRDVTRIEEGQLAWTL
jgi:glycosyltransferase involved in cell wall biosynthesis